MNNIQVKFLITELISHYGNCLDAGEFEAMETLFVDEVVFAFFQIPARVEVVVSSFTQPSAEQLSLFSAMQPPWWLLRRRVRRERHVWSCPKHWHMKDLLSGVFNRKRARSQAESVVQPFVRVQALFSCAAQSIPQ